MQLNVTVKTNKVESKVIKKDLGEYEVWLRSAPIKGQANKELIKVLANYFSVKPNNLRIIKGFKSHLKVIELIK